MEEKFFIVFDSVKYLPSYTLLQKENGSIEKKVGADLPWAQTLQPLLQHPEEVPFPGTQDHRIRGEEDTTSVPTPGVTGTSGTQAHRNSA